MVARFPLLLAVLLPLAAGGARAQSGGAPQAPPPEYAEGLTLLQAGEFAAAAEKFRAATEAAPEFAPAWQQWGYALHADGRLEEAIPAHAKAASFPATAATGAYNLACAYSLLGRLDEGFAALEQALAAGFARWDLLAQDADLARLRVDGRWRRYRGMEPDYGAPLVEDARLLHAWHGERAGDQFGWVAVGAGDADADGVEDVVTSAPFAAGKSGAASGVVYVFSGATGARLHRLEGAAGERLGMSVAGLGDLDGDGRDDFAAGSLGGVVRIWSGGDGRMLREWRGEASEQFGREVAPAGDWDEDGVPDVLLTIPGFVSARGAVEARSGADGAVLLRLEGESPGDAFGSTVSAGGREGGRLLVVGASNAGPGRRGRILVYDAPAGTERFRRDAGPEGVNFGRFFSSVPGDFDGDGQDDVYAVDFESNAGGPGSGEVLLLSGRDGTLLHRLVGQPGDGLGIGDAVAGDADGDGRADLLIGGWTCGDAAASGGAAWLISGRTGRALRTLTCRIPGATFGFDSTTIADCDGDGAREWLVSAAWSGVAGPRTGSVYLFAGERFPRNGR